MRGDGHFHALWMLCALGAATFAAAAAPRRQWLAALAIGFVSVAVLPANRSPDAEIAGVLACAGAMVYLFRPRYAWLAVLFGGVLAGTLVRVLALAAAPLLLSAALVAIGLAATAWLARTRPAFAPEALREEALLIVCTLGLAVAVLPSVIDGWQAAANLNVRVEDVARQAIPVWAISVTASTLLGAAYAMWSRR